MANSDDPKSSRPIQLPEEVNAKGGRKRRLMSVAASRKMVADTLRNLEDENPPGDVETARAIFSGVKVLAELLGALKLEKRMKLLEEFMALERAKQMEATRLLPIAITEAELVPVKPDDENSD